MKSKIKMKKMLFIQIPYNIGRIKRSWIIKKKCFSRLLLKIKELINYNKCFNVVWNVSTNLGLNTAVEKVIFDFLF